MSGGRLWLTGLGRDLPGTAREKHRIKAADRLLGNEGLWAQSSLIYQALAAYLIGDVRHPVVLVDGTGVGPGHYALTAALAHRGRAFPLFSRVQGGFKQGVQVQRDFLASLAKILPSSCTPIIVTDAGFHSNWFDAVLKRGWHFVGRIRNRTQIHVDGEWVSAKSLHQQAGHSSVELGRLQFRRSSPRRYRFVLAPQRRPRNRSRLTQKGRRRRDTTSIRRRRAAREPWLLATSLERPSTQVVAHYATRMQIEETFRDLKNHRYGWALSDVRSKNPKRIEVLLLIASIAVVAMQIIGIASEKANLHRQLQANTTYNRRVLSFFTLARRVIANRLEPAAQALRRASTKLRRQLRGITATPLLST